MPNNSANAMCKAQMGMLILRECGAPANRQCDQCGRAVCAEHQMSGDQNNCYCPECAGTREQVGGRVEPKVLRRARRRRRYHDHYGYHSPYYYGYWGYGHHHHHHHDHFNQHDQEAFDTRQEGLPDADLQENPGMMDDAAASDAATGGGFDDSYDAMES